ncbi:hypothetical protein BTJ49_14210 [Oleiagrimonas sp. MCCC 1A03011]|nr:hypothetical protein BTJ49_14210 [Oleiagrimonas sp. MCCC 1A03011]
MQREPYIVTCRHALICLMLALFVASGAQASSATGDLAGYRLQRQTRVQGVADNLSGLAYDARHDRLLAVVNNPSTLLVLDTDGRMLRRIALDGFEDTEGVALLADGRVAVTEEGRNQIAIFALPPKGIDRARHRDARIFRLDLFAHGNDGYEGLAYDARHDCFWMVKERRPRGLFQLCGLLRGGTVQAITDHSAWLKVAHPGKDLSGIEFDAASGHLLLLSDESRRVTEIARGGKRIARRALDQAHPPQPEGIAVDGHGHLYIVSEPNLFYRYGRD